MSVNNDTQIGITKYKGSNHRSVCECSIRRERLANITVGPFQVVDGRNNSIYPICHLKDPSDGCEPGMGDLVWPCCGPCI